MSYPTHPEATQAALGGIIRAYELGAVPSGATYSYMVWSDTWDRTFGGTLDAHRDGDYRRITTQSFARSLDGARDLDGIARDSLLERALDVTGYECGPIEVQLASALSRDPDDRGVISITSTYIYTTTKEG